MWQRFTQNAKQVVFHSKEQAQRDGTGYVAPEHLLMSLLQAGDCTANKALCYLGKEPSAIRQTMSMRLPPMSDVAASEITLTLKAKRAIDLSFDEARQLANNFIGTEHLLLGILREPGAEVRRIMTKCSITLDEARRAVVAVQGGAVVHLQDTLDIPGVGPETTLMEETEPYTSPLAIRDDAALIVIDIQDTFLAPIKDRDRVIDRSRFMIEIANLFGIPILVTEQNPSRMGGTNAKILEVLPPATQRHDKLCFSSCGIESFKEEWEQADKSQAVIVGIETHICVTQTVHDFLANEIDVFVCADAVSSRTKEAHDIAIERMRQAGAVITHTESVAYEWLKAAGTDEFKSALEIVKRYS